MICNNCGHENPADVSFCANCGVKLSAEAAPAAAPVQQPVYQQPAAPVEQTVPARNKPLSPWAYFGYQLLFSIPVVGFILLIVFSTGAARNINLRNFARSYWCGLLIAVILVIIVLVIYLVTGVSIAAIASEYAY